MFRDFVFSKESPPNEKKEPEEPDPIDESPPPKLSLEVVKERNMTRKSPRIESKRGPNFNLEDKNLFSLEEYTVTKSDSLIGIALEFGVK